MESDPQAPISNHPYAAGASHPKRPFVVTLLILLVLSYTTLGWLGFIEALRHWDFLQEIPLAVPPLYLASRSAFWGLIGLPLIWGLWVGRVWAWYAAQIAAGLYAFYYWLDRLFIAHPSAIAERWPFAIGLTVSCLADIFVVLWLPRSRRFFKRQTETSR